MALVHRVNSNFPPLFNTFYCKCTLNITRFKTQERLESRSRLNSDERVHKDYKTFDQMIRFRQNQARKSILVKLSSFSYVQNLRSLCARFSRVVNIFPYGTSNDQHFVLMELESYEDVTAIRNITCSKWNSDAAYMVTPLFSYNLVKSMSEEKYLRFKLPPSQIFPYTEFEIPSVNEIRQELRKLNSDKLFLVLEFIACPKNVTSNSNRIQDQASEQMILLHKLLTVTDLNVRLRFYTAQQISYFVSRLFLNVDVLPFGSSINGFGQTGCDLDLLCTAWGVSEYHHATKQLRFLGQSANLTSREEQKGFLEVICMVIRTCVPGARNIKKILEARVPIIKFAVLNTNMQCDLSSTNMVALHMTELLYTYGELDWRVRPLVCTIRKWARVATVTRESPGQWISNFSLTLLIIFYLQTKRIIPSISAMKQHVGSHKKNIANSEFDLSWFAYWRRSMNNRESEESLYNLLYGFFEYYSIFDFQTQAICVQQGTLKSKKQNSPLYIYNPLDDSLNVSKNVGALELHRTINNFQNALNILLESEEETAIIKLIDPNSYMYNTSKTMSPLFGSNTTNSSRNDSIEHRNEPNQSKFIDKELFTSETSDIDPSKKVEESIIK